MPSICVTKYSHIFDDLVPDLYILNDLGLVPHGSSGWQLLPLFMAFNHENKQKDNTEKDVKNPQQKMHSQMCTWLEAELCPLWSKSRAERVVMKATPVKVNQDIHTQVQVTFCISDCSPTYYVWVLLPITFLGKKKKLGEETRESYYICTLTRSFC